MSFNLDNVVISTKEHEGFRSLPYIDPLVKMTLQKDDPKALEIIEKYLPLLKLTAGYGTLLYFSELEGTALVRTRLIQTYDELIRRKPIVTHFPYAAQEVLVEMAYQMGVYKLLKFKKTFDFLIQQEYLKASVEMLDSLWYKQLHRLDMLDGTDSINRAEKLSKRIAALELPTK